MPNAENDQTKRKLEYIDPPSVEGKRGSDALV